MKSFYLNEKPNREQSKLLLLKKKLSQTKVKLLLRLQCNSDIGKVIKSLRIGKSTTEASVCMP